MTYGTFLKLKGKGLMPGEGRVTVQIFICGFRSHHNAQLCHSLSTSEKVFRFLDTSSVLNCSPRSAREIPQLSSFVLPLCWASVPGDSPVPDSVEREVAPATECMSEYETWFYYRTSKSSAWVFHLLGEYLHGPQLDKSLFLPHTPHAGKATASHYQGRHSQEPY